MKKLSSLGGPFNFVKEHSTSFSAPGTEMYVCIVSQQFKSGQGKVAS